MAAQLAKAGAPGPKVIGIDEVSIRKGHTYRIVVSDLIRGRPIETYRKIQASERRDATTLFASATLFLRSFVLAAVTSTRVASWRGA